MTTLLQRSALSCITLHLLQVEARLKLDQRDAGAGGAALSLQEDVYGPFSGQAGPPRPVPPGPHPCAPACSVA